MPAKLRIDVIAETCVNVGAMVDATNGAFIPEGGKDGEVLAEFAGRACYQSWSKPNPATATNKGYLANIIEQEHFSVLGHPTVTLYIQGVSRNFTHELVRHHTGTRYSQLSQRFVDSGEMDYVVPPAMRGTRVLEDQLARAWKSAVRDYEIAVDDLLAKGKTRKQAREAARAFLPGCAETKIVCMANLEAWRSIIARRAVTHADAEMREVMVQIAWTLKQGFPNAFQDMHLHVEEGQPDTIFFDLDPDA